MWSGERQRPDVAHPHLDVRALVARRQVVQLEDAEQVVADLDEHAFPESRRLYANGHHSYGLYILAIVAHMVEPAQPCYDANVAFTRWDPLRDLLALHEQIGQLVGTDAPGWTPPVDLYETAGAFVLTAELPGLTREQIEIHAEESRIVIRGERASGPATCLLRAVSSRRARPRPLLARVRAARADRRRKRHRRSQGRRPDGHDPESRRPRRAPHRRQLSVDASDVR